MEYPAYERSLSLDPRLNPYPMYRASDSSAAKFAPDNDQHLIDAWLLEKGKLQPQFPLRQKPASRTISIGTAKALLASAVTLMEKLGKAQEDLRENVESMSRADWKQKTGEIGALKEDFNKVMGKFEDNATLGALKRTIKLREVKRANQKKRKLARREEETAVLEKRAKRHKEIDQWLEGMKEAAERAKMDEKLKKDADCVLFEVTKKKSEARKQVSLISALVKLRTVRDSMATQRGEKTSLEDRQAFGSVTEKLIRAWENAFQNYLKEEQCLKVMLEHNAEADTNAAKAAKQAAIVDEWERLLFGPRATAQLLKNQTYWALTSAERDLETFIAIRRSWDTFLTNISSGTSIPVGWVMPPDEPANGWDKYYTLSNP